MERFVAQAEVGLERPLVLLMPATIVNAPKVKDNKQAHGKKKRSSFRDVMVVGGEGQLGETNVQSGTIESGTAETR